jgi:serine/threonine-protein kinase
MELGRMTDLGEGEVVGERFRIEGVLGKGGMGAVLAATDLEDGSKIALKVMRSAFADDAHLLERFKREAQVLQKIDHPAVVGVKEAGTLPDGVFYIALERLEGETLKSFVLREGRVPLQLLVPVVQGLCGALSAAHEQNVVHRDVKPSNVFLPSRPEQSLSLEGAETLVKLVDFGVAKVAGGRKLTRTGGAVGTFQYMAPEQLRGDPDVDGRADVYSVGVVVYEALTGVHPFKPIGENAKKKPHMEVVQSILTGEYPRLREHRPELPKSLETVVAKAMHHEKLLRYQTAQELADELTKVAREFVVRETTPAPPNALAKISGRPTAPAKVIDELLAEASADAAAEPLDVEAAPLGRKTPSWIWAAAVLAVVAIGTAFFLMQ